MSSLAAGFGAGRRLAFGCAVLWVGIHCAPPPYDRESPPSADDTPTDPPPAKGAPAGPAAPTSTVAGAFLHHLRPLIFEGRRSGEGYFSPDGLHLVFQSEREPKNPFY